MNTYTIVSLILALAPVFGIEPYTALSVAKVESRLNPKAIGTKGEVGLFQIMPMVFKDAGYTKEQMKDPFNNIYLGLLTLQKAKKTCVHKGNFNYLVCYNAGNRNARKIKNPSKFPYVVKIKHTLNNLMSSIRE